MIASFLITFKSVIFNVISTQFRSDYNKGRKMLKKKPIFDIEK